MTEGKPTSRRYSGADKEFAFEVWLLKAGRSCRRVSELLADGSLHPEGVPIEADERTIRRWADAGEWSSRVSQFMRQLAPSMAEGQLVDLFLGRGEAITVFRQILNDPEQATKDRIAAGRELTYAGGLSPVGTKADPTAGLASPADQVEDEVDYRSLSIEELMQLERSNRARLAQTPRTRRALVIA